MGRTIEVNELFERFYQTHTDKYPNISKKHFRRICRGQFMMMKDVINSGGFEPFRLQYLFSCQISKSKIFEMLKMMRDGPCTDKTRRKFYPKIFKHIKENHKDYIKYEDRIKKYTGLTIEDIRKGSLGRLEKYT